MTEQGMSQAELARQVGVAQPTIAKLLNGASRSSSHLHRIARMLQTTPAYLSGETDDPDTGALPLPTLELIAEQFGQVMVPLVDLAADDSDEAPARFEPFRRERLEAVMAGSFADLFACKIAGDAMLPTLVPGALCVVDRAQTVIREQDRIWAVTYAGIRMVRRVRRMAGDQYGLASDNVVLNDVVADAGDLTVVGRVVWCGGAI